MLTLVRIVLGLAGLLAGWFFSYRMWFVDFEIEGSAFLGRGAPFLVGLAAAVVILAATADLQHGLLSSVVLGAMGLGSISFGLGHFGPLFFDLSASAGPLLSLLITGPGGVLLGALLGALWWWLRAGRVRTT